MNTVTFNDPNSGAELIGNWNQEISRGNQTWILADVDGVRWAVPTGWPNNALPVCEESDPAEYASIAYDDDEEGGHRVIAPATFGTHPSMGSDGRYEFDCAHCGDAVQYTGARMDNDYFEVGERVGYHDPVTGEDFCTDCEAKIYGSDDEEAEDE